MTSKPDVELSTLEDGSSSSRALGLFPMISHHRTNTNNFEEEPAEVESLGQPSTTTVNLSQQPSIENSSVVLIRDDGASSVCIDDYDADYQNAMELLRTRNERTSSFPSSARFMTDFDAYNHRVARDVVLKEKVQRQQQRNQRAKYFQNSRTYGNYFSRPNPSAMDTFTPSHTYDNFNGRRQNAQYNHQLNKLNDPFTYHGRQNDDNADEESNPAHAVQPDDVSFVTLDVDALESEDDDEDSLLEGHTGSKYVPKLKRKLYSRHVQLISLGAAYGVGVLLNSSQSFFYAGPLGTLLGYVITGIICYCTMSGFGEMVAFVPSENGVAGVGSRFVDDSLGFALGICYWLSCSMALPSEVTAGAIMLTYYPELSYPMKSITVWITFFLMLILAINLLDVGKFGEIQFFACFISVILLTFLMIVMFAINGGHFNKDTGRIGFRYWDSAKSNVTANYIYGPFRPVFPLQMEADSNGTINITGISGSTGRFLQVWYAICKAAFSYLGTEVVYMAAGEIRNPRKAVPAATKKIFFRIVLLYILAIFAVSLNIYAGDPRLVNLTKQAGKALNGTTVHGSSASLAAGCITGVVDWGYNIPGSNSSPWIIAIQSAGHCAFASGINAALVFFALAAGATHLYASSRTLYGLSAQGLVWRGFSRCTYAGLPYIAILTSFSFSLLAYMTANHTSAQVFNWFVSLTTSAGLLVWAGICFAYIRFYKGLQLRPDIGSRNDISYPFKSPFQPYVAYFGLVSNIVVAVLLGLPLFLKGQWDTQDFFTTYISLLVFVTCYGLHKAYTRCKLVPLDRVDLDSGRKEMERAAWREDRVYNRGVKQRWKQWMREFASIGEWWNLKKQKRRQQSQSTNS